jgi:methylase of polypeptide subunit release factors
MSFAWLDHRAPALLGLLKHLDEVGYDFVTITNASYRRVLARRSERAGRDLRDLLGWSLPVPREAIDPEILALLTTAGVLEVDERQVRSHIRVSRLAGQLFVHSAFASRATDAVFLGPDTYRFARLLQAAAASPSSRLVDLGGGAGVGAIVAAKIAPRRRIQITDINLAALRLAAVNASYAGVDVDLIQTNALDGVAEGFDLCIANPPFMSGGRLYSAGGAMDGAEVSVDWAKAALAKLAPGGRFIMYTASAIGTGGEDRLHAALRSLAADQRADLRYEEIDPDIFGEMLNSAAYGSTERIAAVGIEVTKARL